MPGCIRPDCQFEHNWPREGILFVETCERKCGFCEGVSAGFMFKSAWHLRRHVKNIHCKPGGGCENLTVSDKWTAVPKGGQGRPQIPTMDVPDDRESSDMDEASPSKTSPRKASPIEQANAGTSAGPSSGTGKIKGPLTKTYKQPHPSERNFSMDQFKSTLKYLVGFGFDAGLSFEEIGQTFDREWEQELDERNTAMYRANKKAEEEANKAEEEEANKAEEEANKETEEAS